MVWWYAGLLRGVVVVVVECFASAKEGEDEACRLVCRENLEVIVFWGLNVMYTLVYSCRMVWRKYALREGQQWNWTGHE